MSDPGHISHLVDADGLLRRDLGVLGVEVAFSARAREELRAEIEAQFRAFAATGLTLDHVNAHKHFHLHPYVGAMILEIGPSYGMRSLRAPIEPANPFSDSGSRSFEQWFVRMYARRLAQRAHRADVATADYVFGVAWSGAWDARRLQSVLAGLPDGLVEIYLHPATCDEFPGAAAGYRHRNEMEALLDAACAKAFDEGRHAPGGYADALASLPNADN